MDPTGPRSEPAVTFDVVDPASADARVAIGQYFAELDARFSDGFDPGAGGAGHDAEHLSAPTGAFVVARRDVLVVGCGGVQRVDAETAEIKRMWVLADERGHGLGRRLLAHLEGVARSLGYGRVVLDTNESLTEAVTMYARSGYRTIERYNDNPYAHHWFAKDL
jgi:GNAT superfamily N-acetyltransferase